MVKKILTKKIDIERVDEDGVLHHELGYERFTIETEPPFAKIYFGDIGRMFGLSPLTMDVLFLVVTRMGYVGGEVSISGGLKKMMCERLGIYSHQGGVSIPTFNNCIYKLLKKGLLIKKEKGVYLVNPFIFGRGEWKDVKEIRSRIEYKEDRISIITERK